MKNGCLFMEDKIRRIGIIGVVSLDSSCFSKFCKHLCIPNALISIPVLKVLKSLVSGTLHKTLQLHNNAKNNRRKLVYLICTLHKNYASFDTRVLCKLMVQIINVDLDNSKSLR